MKKITTSVFVTKKELEVAILNRLKAYSWIDEPIVMRNEIEFIAQMESGIPNILIICTEKDEINPMQMMHFTESPAFIIGVTSDDKEKNEMINKGFFDCIESEVDFISLYRIMNKINHILNSFHQIPNEVNESEPQYVTYEQKKEKKSTLIKSKNSKIVVQFDDVVYVIQKNHCLNIVKKNGSVQYVHQSVKSFLTYLPGDRFVRINRSTIVNLTHMTEYKSKFITVKQETFPITRVYSAHVKEIIANWERLNS